MILSIIIVNYNGEKFLKNCLDSVMSQHTFCQNFNTIVIDNASDDASLNILNQYNPHIQLIKNRTNVGFPAAHNQLLPELNTPYLWLLNNDTEFDHMVDVITPIIGYLDAHPDVVGLSPKLLNSDQTLQAQGGFFNQWKFKSKKTRPVSFLSGASLFIRTDFFKKINGFDPHLFFYNDDFDFAKQAQKHHKQLIYFPSIHIIHHGGLSTKFRKIDSLIAGYYGSIYLCKKYYSSPIFFIYYYMMRLLLEIKSTYHHIINTTDSMEWTTKLAKLRRQLKNEF